MSRYTFVGNFISESSSESQYAKLLEKMGHKIYRIQESGARREKIWRESLRSDALIFIHTHHWSTRGNISFEDLFLGLKKAGIPTLSYHLDLYLGLGRQTDLETDPFYKNIEYFFTVDKLMADWFNENTSVKGVFLPAGVFDDEAYMLPPKRVSYDILFTGSSNYHPEYPFRQQLIAFLSETYGDRFLHVGKDTVMGNVRGEALNQLYANAKVTIGDTLNIGFSYPWYSSDRLFEVTGRGGFLIYPDIQGLDTFFKRDKEVVFYKHGDLTDLKEKIDHYLNNESEREAIRKAGFERTKRDHLYSHRWNFILETIKK